MLGFENAVRFALALTAQASAAAKAESAARWEQQIVTLVRQLGDQRFVRREAAHKALLREGAKILPVLDRLGPQGDAEARRRMHNLGAALTWCKVAAVWEKKLQSLTDTINGGRLSCLSGRVSLLGPPRGVPLTVDREIRVRLYDHTPRGGNAGPVLLEQWVFPPEVLRLLVKQGGNAGEKRGHVALVLPWVMSNRPDIRKVSLAVHYAPPEGPPAECRSDVFTLERVPVEDQGKPKTGR